MGIGVDEEPGHVGLYNKCCICHPHSRYRRRVFHLCSARLWVLASGATISMSRFRCDGSIGAAVLPMDKTWREVCLY